MNNDDWQKIKELFNRTIDLPMAERTSVLEKIADNGLRREVEKLIAAHESAGDFIVEPAIVEACLVEIEETDFYLGKQIDSYKILREIGAGGMGTVYLAARDDDFERQVAVKLIKRGMDTSAVLKRFVVERQILANLEHPNIASLLDGGSTIDGLPYLVMEYVAGEPINKFCDSHQFSTEERLKLFQEICGAVSYAHQNLIVHRDLKPSNILVTAEGAPKLLDFGIAKLLHPDWSLETAEATATMFRLMTPEYASPEQLRGLPITTASDVYSLGVVLYELLTRERPFKIEGRLPSEAANIVLTLEPIKPSLVINSKSKVQGSKTVEQSPETTDEQSPKSKVQSPKSQNPKSLRGDLDNIILKALRKEPERRYLSVQEFAEDIRRHLAGLPVSATADTSSYRAGKFFKRHRLGVFAGLLIALTLLSATAITTWQAVVARREQAKAEQRFNQVRKLANTVLFEYHDGIANLAGSTPIREKMVKDALEYLDNLSAENINDPSLQSELAAAYQKVGDVQGAPYRANLGDYAGALESHKKALVIREKLSAGFPQNTEIRLDLAKSYGAVGELSQVTGAIPTALENYRKAFAVFDSLDDKSAETKRELGILDVRFAKSLATSGDLSQAIQSFRKGITLTDELIAANPNDASLKRNHALAHIYLGDALDVSGKLDEALAAHQTAFALFQPMRLLVPS